MGENAEENYLAETQLGRKSPLNEKRNKDKSMTTEEQAR